MDQDRAAKAQSYLKTLCAVKPNRRTGSSGNRDATDFFAEAVRPYGYEIDATPFQCLDHVSAGASLTQQGRAYRVYPSPYTLGCDLFAQLIAVSTVAELASVDCGGQILLMKDAICSEQLMPKNFVFYNPEHHQQIIALLESRRPAAIITATGEQPEQVGALVPFPLIVDGDFDIPSVYCRDDLGAALAARQGEPFQLEIDARRLRSSATNVIARLNAGAATKIVLTAHIDAYEDSIGALDNASGIVVLLLCAEMLSAYRGEHCIEIAALNGEDHYSAAGQMDYLERYGGEFPQILLAINIDDIGYTRGRSAYSCYECPPPLESQVGDLLRPFDGLVRGERWFSGDHMIFVQRRVPSIALTSEFMPALMRTVTHTSADTPALVDCSKLVHVAEALHVLVESLPRR